MAKQTYEVGKMYEDFVNLEVVGEYHNSYVKPVPIDKEITLCTYVDRFYNATVRFKREEGVRGYQYLITDIYDFNQGCALKELPTVTKDNPNLRHIKVYT